MPSSNLSSPKLILEKEEGVYTPKCPHLNLGGLVFEKA